MNLNILIREALREDVGSGDVTTRFFVPRGSLLRARIVAKAPGILCGIKIARRVFSIVAKGCRITEKSQDGDAVKPGQTVMEVRGGPSVLTAERTALNFLQHLSGISTLTARYAQSALGTSAKIYDTRKTLPGWRDLEKYAVRCGGGFNHRMGLYDAVLLKDNHWASGVDIFRAAAKMRRLRPGMILEIEAADINQVERALDAGADIILLDNMTPDLIRKSVKIIRKSAPRAQIEISGGVTLKTVRTLARLGPDRISIGRITHSAPALDMSLEIK
ncbi:MAG: carboxylating nicotinate-nucleotide diphosphorylase [Elusimicrobiota bacterium]